MEKKLSVGEKVNRTLESLDGINSVEVPDGLEESIFIRIQNEYASSVPSAKSNFFWAAAILLLAINVVAVINYSSNSNSQNVATAKNNANPQEQVANYYFSGGTSWY